VVGADGRSDAEGLAVSGGLAIGVSVVTAKVAPAISAFVGTGAAVDAGPSSADLLTVTDAAGNGVFHNHQSDDLSGLIEARYLVGLRSLIRYTGAE
jgi:hypothetical protein